MATSEINKSMGTKWFFFYTKIRPWLAGISFFIALCDFFVYPEVYLTYGWLLLNLAFSLVIPILSIVVAVKANENYREFVRIVKIVLAIETAGFSYQVGVQQYINSEFNFGVAFLSFALAFLCFFFLWYRLNAKYFERRISQPEPKQKIETPSSVSRLVPVDEPASASSNELLENVNEICFCRKCGAKLEKDSRFCQKCGTKIKAEL